MENAVRCAKVMHNEIEKQFRSLWSREVSLPHSAWAHLDEFGQTVHTNEHGVIRVNLGKVNHKVHTPFPKVASGHGHGGHEPRRLLHA